LFECEISAARVHKRIVFVLFDTTMALMKGFRLLKFLSLFHNEQRVQSTLPEGLTFLYREQKQKSFLALFQRVYISSQRISP